jgi:hypothetical protein
LVLREKAAVRGLVVIVCQVTENSQAWAKVTTIL